MYGCDEEAHPDKCCWISLTFKTPAGCKRKLLNRLLWCVFCYCWTLNYNALAVLGRDDTRLSKRCKTKNKKCLRWPPSEMFSACKCCSSTLEQHGLLFCCDKENLLYVQIVQTLILFHCSCTYATSCMTQKIFKKKKNTIESRCVVWSKHYVTATISKLPPCLRIVKVF